MCWHEWLVLFSKSGINGLSSARHKFWRLLQGMWSMSLNYPSSCYTETQPSSSALRESLLFRRDERLRLATLWSQHRTYAQDCNKLPLQ
jgi:hypothetical protein